eukprot:g417.t1
MLRHAARHAGPPQSPADNSLNRPAPPRTHVRRAFGFYHTGATSSRSEPAGWSEEAPPTHFGGPRLQRPVPQRAVPRFGPHFPPTHAVTSTTSLIKPSGSGDAISSLERTGLRKAAAVSHRLSFIEVAEAQCSEPGRRSPSGTQTIITRL